MFKPESQKRGLFVKLDMSGLLRFSVVLRFGGLAGGLIQGAGRPCRLPASLPTSFGRDRRYGEDSLLEVCFQQEQCLS